jgi:glutamate--cysteine ligase
MSVLQVGGGLIESRDQLATYLESGCKPAARWRIGTEHEKFGYRTSDFGPVPYEGPNGIRAMLERMMRFDWQPIREGDTLIGLVHREGANISLEPGGQFELSGAPLVNLHETCFEVNNHLDQVREVAGELGLGFLGMGFAPTWRRDQIPIMPKGRYAIMRRYMQLKGNLGLDMMFRTCTVQVNLDFSSEADMVKKFRVSLALQPLATALFAASPFYEGKPNGYQSYRRHIWSDTDADRTGDIPFVFDEGFGFERYVDYALDVPMYFVYREGKYIDVAGQSFRDFMAGKLPGLPGEVPSMDDWANHLTTLFPEVRIKKFMEMRGADGGPWQRLCALPAFWTGLLYDQTALDAAYDLIKDWTPEERAIQVRDVARLGLRTTFRNGTLLDVAKRAVEISAHGLAARAKLDHVGADEGHFINVLRRITETGKSLADEMLERYNGAWDGDISRIFTEYAY